MIITESDMRVHLSTCTGDKEVIEVENVRTQETVMEEPVSQETPRSTSSSHQFKGRFSRIDSSMSGTGSPSSSFSLRELQTLEFLQLVVRKCAN